MLDHAECEKARMGRDPAYDGRFFSGVRTTGIYCRPVCPVRPAHGAYRLCHPNGVPVETAEPSDWCDAPDCVRGAMERRILVECKVRAHPIVVGGVIRQHMPEVPFPQYHDTWSRHSRRIEPISRST